MTFLFQIQFENLSNEELGALLWVLDVAKDTGYRLKLGMGKPYGLGAIKITSTLHLQDHIQRYQGLLKDSRWLAPSESAIGERMQQALKTMY